MCHGSIDPKQRCGTIGFCKLIAAKREPYVVDWNWIYRNGLARLCANEINPILETIAPYVIHDNQAWHSVRAAFGLNDRFWDRQYVHEPRVLMAQLVNEVPELLHDLETQDPEEPLPEASRDRLLDYFQQLRENVTLDVEFIATFESMFSGIMFDLRYAVRNFPLMPRELVLGQIDDLTAVCKRIDSQGVLSWLVMAGDKMHIREFLEHPVGAVMEWTTVGCDTIFDELDTLRAQAAQPRGAYLRGGLSEAESVLNQPLVRLGWMTADAARQALENLEDPEEE